MTRACPFCGDTREPLHDVEEKVHWVRCQCCGAQGPAAINMVVAYELWNQAWPAGQSDSWLKLYEKDT